MSSARALVSLLLVAGGWSCSSGNAPPAQRGGGLPDVAAGGAIGSGGSAMGVGGKLTGSGGVMGGVGGTTTGGKTGTGGAATGGAGGTGGAGVGGTATGGAAAGGAATGGAATGGAATGGAATGGTATGGVPGTVALTTGLIGYWKFDEADTTGGAIDSSGTNNGTYSNPAPTRSTAVPPKLGVKSTACLTFNGTNNQVILPAVPAYGNWTAATSYSISVWVSVAALANNWKGIVANEASLIYCGLYISNVNAFAYQSNEATASAAPATVTTWHHLAIVQDGANNIQRLYLDGSASAGSSTAQDCTTSAPFRFGTPDGLDGYFNGSIDDVRFYNRALNQAEITALANGQQ